MSVEIVYKGRSNPNSVIFLEDINDGNGPQPINFNDPVGATRMTLSFKGETVVADTDVDASLIDWDSVELEIGEVVFNLNDLDITSFNFLPATFTVYDPAHLNGQIITLIKDEILKFRFCET